MNTYKMLSNIRDMPVYACYTLEDIEYFTSSSLTDIFTQLVEGMSHEEHLLHPDVTALIKSFVEELGCVVLGVIGDTTKIIGFCRLIYLTTDDDNAWYEFGSVYVCDDMRNMGISTEMYKAFLAHHTDKCVLATTTNLAALAVGRKVGLVVLPRKELPAMVWQSSCTCGKEKTLSDSPATCELAYQERGGVKTCYFRVTKSTHEVLVSKKVE